MIVVAVWLFLVALPARAALAPAPETEVEISIYNLVKRKPRLRGLPADYGDRVAKTIEGVRSRLTGCLAGDEAKSTFSIELRIAGDGRGWFAGRQEAKPTSPLVCILTILSTIQYPRHGLSEPVTVKFPLTLERRTL